MKLKSSFCSLASLALVSSLVSCATVTPQAPVEIDDQANTILKAMSGKLAAARKLSFESSRTIDPSLIEGRKVAEATRGMVSIARPNQLRASSQSRKTSRILAYDGMNMLVWDKSANVYGKVKTGRTIDKMIDDLEENWGFNPPLADLLVADPYSSLTGGGGTGKLVGTQTIGGASCQHVSFKQSGLVWDLWVAKSDSLPRKFMITFTDRPGNPKITSRMWNWNLAPSQPSGFFAPDTGDATEVEMIPR